MENLKNADIFAEELAKYRVKCKCGHVLYITNANKKGYKICYCCGRKVYKNKELEQKDKFKEKLLKEIRNV